jgi:hypothetical protein
MSCNLVETIVGSECIGDSRNKINSNFLSLDTAACYLSSQIDGSNTRISALSAYVLNLDIPDPNSIVYSLIGGDGIQINGETGVAQTGTDLLIETAYNIQHINVQSFKKTGVTNTANLIQNYPLVDGTTIDFYNFPYNSVTPPAVTFDVTSISNKRPLLSLYWMASGASNITLFATNSAAGTTTALRGNTHPNNQVYYTHIDGNTAFIGGTFTAVGGVTRRRFGVVDLQGGQISPTLGPRGALSSVPGSGLIGDVERNFLNSVGTAGFNSTVYDIKTFEINNKKYLCVAGAFTNGPAGDNTGTALSQRFSIFDMTNNFNCEYTYTFNRAVYTMLSADKYLYLAGEFNSGRRNDSGATSMTMKGITRIDMTDFSIDTVFTANTVNPNEGIFRGGRLGDNSYYIYSLAYHNGFLFTGGNHIARVGTGSSNSHRRLMAHLTTTANAGKVISNWQPIVNSYVMGLTIDSSTNSVLYAGGYFTTFRLFGGTDIRRDRVLALDVKDISTNPGFEDVPLFQTTPSLYTTWAPVCNNYVNNITLHDTFDLNTPVYLGGLFTTINGRPASRAGTVTKANLGYTGPGTGTPVQVLPEWAPSPNTAFSWFHKPGIQRIPTTSSLSGIFLNGSFTTIAGSPRYYFARVNGRQENIPVPLSSVEWVVAGTIVGEGGDLSINLDTTTALTGVALPSGQVNKTVLPTPQEIFDNINPGDFCRFIIRRPVVNDTYSRDVWLLGASLDYSLQEEEEV